MSGFSGAPKPLGIDNKGRDVLSFIPGDVPARWQTFTDAQVRTAAILLRRMHDATRGTELAGEHPVVCHNDPGPNNVVFRDEAPVAFIDFDMAAPGSPLEDLGYMAWSWCLSSKPSRLPVAEQVAQVRVLIDAYGLDTSERQGLPDAVLERQQRNVSFWKDRKLARHTDSTGRAQIDEIVAWTQREMVYARSIRDALHEAL